ncbi:MAG: hypothetical protein IJM62_05080 [Lachnospiraceae bacterium]|nr:hypothetical protein [Lachnospiraceae bacterium]
MKRLLSAVLCLLMVLNSAVIPVCAETNEELGASRVTKAYATFQGETTDVTRYILEVDGDMADKVTVKVEMSEVKSGFRYEIYQMIGEKTNFLASSDTTTIVFNADQMGVGGVCYLVVRNSSGKLETWQVLNFRIHKGETSKKFPERIGSDFGKGLTIDLSDLCHGMEFQVLPFAIPVTFKRFEGGRFAIGLGYNSSDAKFWNDMRNGTHALPISFEKLRDIALNDENKGTSVTKGMGAVIVVSGYVEGNIYNTDLPLHGRLQAYVGTGFNTVGQYAILTWEITGTIGAEGAIDLSFIYDGRTDSYDAQVDRLNVGGTGGLELFGGLGLAGIFAVGVYGAASLSIHFDIVPEACISDFIVAGQLGVKVKVLGKVVVNFKLIAGSYDFVSGKVGAPPLQLEVKEKELGDAMLAQDYGSAVILTQEASGGMKWQGNSVQSTPRFNSEWIDDADFSRKIASNISPGSQVQIANVQGSAVPQMNVIFLSDDTGREAGNRATLMNTYYDIATGFLSDPIKIDDDGTADFDPYLYHSDRYSSTYLVWKNAIKPLNNQMTLSETADNTEIEFAEFQVGGSWKYKTRITDLAGSGQYAAGAKVGSDSEGEPVVTYYTNDVEDPAGFAGTHGIYVARRISTWKWENEKIAELDGSITDVDTEWFGGGQVVAVSRTAPDGSKSLIIYKDGKQVMERKNAFCGKFMEMGYNYVVLTWYESGRIWMMEENGKITAVTPADLEIPPSEYKLLGKFGSSGLMLVGKSIKDSTGRIFALYSKNGGITWAKLDLTNIIEFSTIGDLGVAFTYEDEPILVYSLQNYETNYDDAITDAENFVQGKIKSSQELNAGQSFTLGADDERFTDTTCDLYIQARRDNSHISFEGGVALDEDHARPGQFTPAEITIRNTGLYTVEKEYIMYKGVLLKTATEKLEPGEAATVKVELPLPKNPGTEPFTFEIEVSEREDRAPQSRGTVTVGIGHLEGFVEHIYEDRQEKLVYRVDNYGFSDKEVTILVRDEDRDVEISREVITIENNSTYEDAVVAPKGLFSLDGCTNVTIYVLFDGETEDSTGLTAGRMLSVEPLDKAYAKEFVLPDKVKEENGETSSDTETETEDTADSETETETETEEASDDETEETADDAADESEPIPENESGGAQLLGAGHSKGIKNVGLVLAAVIIALAAGAAAIPALSDKKKNRKE